MAGTLIPSAATVHLRPQRGDEDASWPVGRRRREGRIYKPGRTERKRDDKQVYTSSILHVTPNLPTRSSLEAFARGVLVPGSIFCDNLHKRTLINTAAST